MRRFFSDYVGNHRARLRARSMPSGLRVRGSRRTIFLWYRASSRGLGRIVSTAGDTRVSPGHPDLRHLPLLQERVLPGQRHRRQNVPPPGELRISENRTKPKSALFRRSFAYLQERGAIAGLPGGPGRIRTSNQTVMSGGTKIAGIDFPEDLTCSTVFVASR